MKESVKNFLIGWRKLFWFGIFFTLTCEFFCFLIVLFPGIERWFVCSKETFWGVVTGIFIHCSQEHFYGNLLFLWLSILLICLFPPVEKEQLHVMILICFSSAVLANIIDLLYSPNAVSAGSSGVVYALGGIFFVGLLKNTFSLLLSTIKYKGSFKILLPQLFLLFGLLVFATYLLLTIAFYWKEFFIVLERISWRVHITSFILAVTLTSLHLAGTHQLSKQKTL